MDVIKAIYLFITYGVITVIVGVILLMLLRLLLNYADVNPFSWPALTVRRFSDPLVTPVRRALVGFGVQPNITPLITILLVILVGWFVRQLAASILNTAAGVLFGLKMSAFVALTGYLIYGALALYSLLIFIRIIFSWGMVRYANPLMRFLVNATDPLLIPLRRMIPPFGMFDLSPIVAFIILWLFQAAVAGTLLHNFPIQFLD
jgi:YggT family protein